MSSRRINAIPTPLAAAEARRVAAAATAAAAAELVAKQARRAAKAQRAATAATTAAKGLVRESASAFRPHEPKRAEALDEQSELRGDDAEAAPNSSSSSNSSGDVSMEARFKQMEQHFNARMAELEARNEQLEAEAKARQTRDEAEAQARSGEADVNGDEQERDDVDGEARTSDEESGDETQSALPPVETSAAAAPNRAPGGPQQSPTGGWARTTTMAIPPPPRPALLQYEKIEAQLETWLKQYLVWFRAARVFDESDRVAQALATVDATVQRWWETRAEAKQADSWAAFEAALRATFIRRDEASRAAAKIRELRMAANEDYHQYFLRVEDLLMRANIGDEDKLMLGIVFERFDQARWPIASAQTAGDIRTGRITTFSALRDALANRVLDEPKLHRSSAASSSSSSSKQARLNAATTRAEDDGGTEDNSQSRLEAKLEAVQRQLSALQAGAGQGGRGAPKRCGRCGDKTHWSAECKAPDNRECFKCHQKGHIARDCKQEANAREGVQQPLNREARQ